MSDANREYRTCGDQDVAAGRAPSQLSWYRFAKRFILDLTVLDAGCGLGHGIDIMREAPATVQGQDLDPRLAKDHIRVCPITEIPDKSFDVVTNIDVIEHVEDDHEFVRQLARIARKAIFITTPNWTASRCHWPYHVREYTPRQFTALLAPLGRITLFKGVPEGSIVHQVRHPTLYNILNDLRTFKLTAFPTRILNNILPFSRRIHSHNAALIEL